MRSSRQARRTNLHEKYDALKKKLRTAGPFMEAFNHAEKLREEGFKKGYDDGYAVGYQVAEQKFNPEKLAKTEAGLVVPASSLAPPKE